MLANCGIQVKLQYGNYEQVLGKWPNGIIPGRKFDLSLFVWTTTSIPACEYYQTWNIPSDENPEGLNYPGYSGATYDTACYDAHSSISAADMSNYHKRAARLFSQELPVLPLYSYLNVSAAAPHIMAFTLNSTEYRFWWIEEIHLGETENIPTTGGSLTSPDDTTNYMFPEGSFSEVRT
jgi:ABC-type oligopeptide transport system substrate-binding subunit